MRKDDDLNYDEIAFPNSLDDIISRREREKEKDYKFLYIILGIVFFSGSLYCAFIV